MNTIQILCILLAVWQWLQCNILRCGRDQKLLTVPSRHQLKLCGNCVHVYHRSYITRTQLLMHSCHVTHRLQTSNVTFAEHGSNIRLANTNLQMMSRGLVCGSLHWNDPQESLYVLGSNYPCLTIFEGDLSDVATCTVPRCAVGELLDGDVVVRVVILTVGKMGSSCRFFVLYVLTVLYICEGRISDKRLCGDPSCSGTKSLYYCQYVLRHACHLWIVNT
jgi:hypothetical protein